MLRLADFHHEKCLPNEMQSLFHRGETYFTGSLIPFSSGKWDKKYHEYPVDPVKKTARRAPSS